VLVKQCSEVFIGSPYKHEFSGRLGIVLIHG